MNDNNEISASQRRELRAKAHHLHPVVAVGQHGLTPAVQHEIDVALTAHELIKIRVFSDDRAEREALLSRICAELGCAPVQHVGKVLIVWRRTDAIAEADKSARVSRKPGSVIKETSARRTKGSQPARASQREPRGSVRDATSDLSRRRRKSSDVDSRSGKGVVAPRDSRGVASGKRGSDQERTASRARKTFASEAHHPRSHDPHGAPPSGAGNTRARTAGKSASRGTGPRSEGDDDAGNLSKATKRPPRRGTGKVEAKSSTSPPSSAPRDRVARAARGGTADASCERAAEAPRGTVTTARAPRGVPGSGMRRRRRVG
jgi:RNA-binding protein